MYGKLAGQAPTHVEPLVSGISFGQFATQLVPETKVDAGHVATHVLPSKYDNVLGQLVTQVFVVGLRLGVPAGHTATHVVPAPEL